jgi:uncharacterized membrane protein
MILIGVVVYALVVPQSNQKSPAPLEILKERYVRGEISRRGG